MGSVDEALPFTLLDFLQLLFFALGSMLLACSINPWLFLIMLPLALFFIYFRYYYLKSARDIKRLEGAARSPIYAHFSTTLAGLATIRSHGGAQELFARLFEGFQDGHSRANLSFVLIGRWLGMRLDILVFFFVFFTTFGCVLFRDSFGAGAVGLVLVYTLNLTGAFQWCVRQSAEVENLMTSCERVLEYGDLPRESDVVGCASTRSQAVSTAAGATSAVSSKSAPGKGTAIEMQPPGLQPGSEKDGAVCPVHRPASDEEFSRQAQGDVRFDHLTLQYSLDSPPVLKDFTVHVHAGERVGIVGRTGAGKSSLIAALFRLAPVSGTIYFGDTPSCSVPLATLRRAITVIPQDPGWRLLAREVVSGG
jgi:ATP-binding cassette subfamily C (CFTR/MRP) protein 4